MTASEKANKLVREMVDTYDKTQDFCYDSTAKECALIAVEEISSAIYTYLKDSNELQNADREFAYWEEVKNELNKL
jgi:hypothetical protein